MNSLLNYGSDDDCDESADEKSNDLDTEKTSAPKHFDVNYEEVQMDLSEESNDGRSDKDNRRSKDEQSRSDRERDREKDKRRRDDRDRDRYRRERERSRERRRSGSKSRRSDSRSRRSNSKERRSSSKDEGTRERRSRDTSGERKRSRSPRRSKSRDRGRKPKRYRDRPEEDTQKKEEDKGSDNRFFMPGITGRFREQIERRKLLWQKKEPEKQVDVSKTKKVWEGTTFAQDTDGKVASKFKRLMGIKNAAETSNSGTDVLKKQEEMFSSMEQQYEVARTATHTMRGVGLGFGSFQR